MQDSLSVAMQAAVMASFQAMFQKLLVVILVSVILPIIGNALFQMWTNKKAVAANAVPYPEFNKSIERTHIEREKGDKELHARIDKSNELLKDMSDALQYVRGRIDVAIQNGKKSA